MDEADKNARKELARKMAMSRTKVVKKSKTNICHAPGTKYYKQTKYYKAFKTLKDCLESGGRLQKRN